MSVILGRIIRNRLFESFLIWAAYLAIYLGLHLVWKAGWSTDGFAIFAFLPSLIVTIGNSGASGIVDFLRSTSRTSVGFFKRLLLYDAILLGFNIALLLFANVVIGDGFTSPFVFSWPVNLAMLLAVSLLVFLIQGFSPRGQGAAIQRSGLRNAFLFIFSYAGLIALCLVFYFSADAGLAIINLWLSYMIYQSPMMRSNFPQELRRRICGVLAGLIISLGVVGYILNGWNVQETAISSQKAQDIARAEFAKLYGDQMSSSYKYKYKLEGENWRITGLKGEFVEIFVHSKTGVVTPAIPKAAEKEE